MSRKREFKKPVRFCMVLEAEHLEHVQQIAIQMSAREKRVITMTEVLRMAIENCYPLPKGSNNMK